jgi:hypothetical protein
MERALDEFEEKDDSRWSNIKALQGAAWKARLRKKVGPYRIIFRKFLDRRGGGLCHPHQIERHLSIARVALC